MSVIIEIIGGLVRVGMEAYDASKQNEAEALSKLDAALIGARAHVKKALADLDAARAGADAKIAAAIKARG